MNNANSGNGRRQKRSGKNYLVTKSGNSIKLNRNLMQRWVSRKDAKQQRKAERQATLPKDRIRRFAAHFNPKRMYHYWFSRDGGIMALKILGIGIVAGFVLLLGFFAYFRKDLPNLKDISGANIGGSISYYDRSGQTLLWEDYDAVKRIPIKTDQMSQYMRDATVAVEDKDFYKHGGFDVRGILRAGINDVSGGSTQGGSTITQQLVKLTQNWTENRTITRKIKEVILAVELERTYSKSDILTGYLNAAPYGNIEYGVQAASADYFHKDAKDLTLDEAAFLAAIPKSPSIYSPYGPYFNKTDVIGRQQYILDLMVAQGMVSKDDAEKAKKVDVLKKIHPQLTKYAGIKAPYFVLAAKSELENKYGADTVNRGGWKVVTTLDTKLQDTAEKLVANNLSNVSRYGADEEAVVGEDVQTGQIVSLVGGTDFTNKEYGQNNFAAGIKLPPGSSFKPYDYTTLIDNNTSVGAGSVLYDKAGPLPGYPCTNHSLPKNGGNCLQDYDFLQPGPLTLRYALGGSRNIPAVKAMLSAVPNDTSDGHVDSVNKVISTATKMMDNPYVDGNTYNCYSDEALTKTTQCYGASAIGDGAFLHLDDHVNGLSTLARMGQAIPRTYILKITDAANKTVYEFKQPKADQVIKPDTAYIVNDMASDPKASYLPGSCTDSSCTPLAGGGYKFHRYNGWKFAIKTGTTNDGYDGLMTSWSPKYAVVTWVGNHTRHVELRTSMEYLTEPLARGWMEAAHDGLKPQTWKQPQGIQTLPAFVVRNHIHYGDIEPSPSNDLFPSWYKARSATASATTIDKVSGKAATNCTPALAKQFVTNGNAGSWNVDLFAGGSPSSGSGSSSSLGQDDVHVCGEAGPSISQQNWPGTCSPSCSLDVLVDQGAHPLNSSKFPGTLTLVIGGKTVQSKKVSSPGVYTFSGISASGTQTVTAQIVDSVLYSSSTSKTIKFSSSGGSSSKPVLSFSHQGGHIHFTWTGGTGPNFTVFDNSNNILCSATNNDTSCNTSGSYSGDALVQDSSGNESDTITVN